VYKRLPFTTQVRFVYCERKRQRTGSAAFHLTITIPYGSTVKLASRLGKSGTFSPTVHVGPSTTFSRI
jgi:hypothetical protein